MLCSFFKIEKKKNYKYNFQLLYHLFFIFRLCIFEALATTVGLTNETFISFSFIYPSTVIKLMNSKFLFLHQCAVSFNYLQLLIFFSYVHHLFHATFILNACASLGSMLFHIYLDYYFFFFYDPSRLFQYVPVWSTKGVTRRLSRNVQG